MTDLTNPAPKPANPNQYQPYDNEGDESDMQHQHQISQRKAEPLKQGHEPRMLQPASADKRPANTGRFSETQNLPSARREENELLSGSTWWERKSMGTSDPGWKESSQDFGSDWHGITMGESDSSLQSKGSNGFAVQYGTANRKSP